MSRPMEPASRRWVAATALAAGLFCAVVVLIPFAETNGLPAASLGRLALKPACHQITERCLDLGSGPLPVCARCAGLYAGGFAGLFYTALACRRFRPSWRWVMAAAAPSIVDFFVGLTGLPCLPNWPRFGAAFVPGLLIGLLVADAICATVVLNHRQTPPNKIT